MFKYVITTHHEGVCKTTTCFLTFLVLTLQCPLSARKKDVTIAPNLANRARTHSFNKKRRKRNISELIILLNMVMLMLLEKLQICKDF